MSISLDELVKKAESGLSAGQIELGNCYLVGYTPDGKEIQTDYKKAKYWLEKAHERGAYTATYLLGTIYHNGMGVQKDMMKAIKLYRDAVDKGAYLPCIDLARIYSVGDGVNKSVDLAIEWYKKVLTFEGKVDDAGEMKEARDYLENN